MTKIKIPSISTEISPTKSKSDIEDLVQIDELIKELDRIEGREVDELTEEFISENINLFCDEEMDTSPINTTPGGITNITSNYRAENDQSIIQNNNQNPATQTLLGLYVNNRPFHLAPIPPRTETPNMNIDELPQVLGHLTKENQKLNNELVALRVQYSYKAKEASELQADYRVKRHQLMKAMETISLQERESANLRTYIQGLVGTLSNFNTVTTTSYKIIPNSTIMIPPTQPTNQQNKAEDLSRDKGANTRNKQNNRRNKASRPNDHITAEQYIPLPQAQGIPVITMNK